MHVHQEKKLHSKQSGGAGKARFEGIMAVIIISGESLGLWLVQFWLSDALQYCVTERGPELD